MVINKHSKQVEPLDSNLPKKELSITVSDKPTAQPSTTTSSDTVEIPARFLAKNAANKITLKEHIHFLHQSTRSPVQQNWLKAIRNNHYILWPHINVHNVYKHLPQSEVMSLGHMP